MHDLTNGELRELLRQHALVVTPGELLVVTVPPDWNPRDVRELSDGLNAVCADPYLLGSQQPPGTGTCDCACHPYYPTPGTGIRVLVVPGTAVTIAREPPDPFPGL